MKTTFQSLVMLAAATLALGCSSTPPLKPNPVDVAGAVTGPSGQPVGGVTVNFFPTTSDQSQGGALLKADGKFAVKLIPGKYTFSFEGSAAAMKAIPATYHSNDAAHTFEVPSAGDPALAIKLAN